MEWSDDSLMILVVCHCVKIWWWPADDGIHHAPSLREAHCGAHCAAYHSATLCCCSTVMSGNTSVPDHIAEERPITTAELFVHTERGKLSHTNYSQTPRWGVFTAPQKVILFREVSLTQEQSLSECKSCDLCQDHSWSAQFKLEPCTEDLEDRHLGFYHTSNR